MASPDLQALREALDAIDRRLIGLLSERMELVERVASAKLDAASPFRDPEREDRLLVRLREGAAAAGLDPHEVERLFRVVLAMSVARQQAYVRALDHLPLRVAYQGTEGSYSHQAAQGRYAGRPGGVLLAGFETFRQAAESVLGGANDLALLPIENTTAGSINETYDLLAEGRLTITGEVVSAVEHCLLGLPDARIEELRAALSHPQALGQCESFFREHPGIRAQVEFDTAGAARKVKELGDPALAAIASEAAAGVHGLAILRRGIQTQAANATRFVEIGLHPVPVSPGERAKTSILLALADRPGALGAVLTELARRQLNLTKLESRPIPGDPWDYRFYLDVEGHAASAPFGEAMAAIAPLTVELRVLGTYPAAR